MPRRVAIAQIAMHWTTAENLQAICEAVSFASNQGASICGFSELALTGFHREIGREARPEIVDVALEKVRQQAGKLSVGVAIGAPTFGEGGAKFNSHVLIDEDGEIAAVVSKRGLTAPEATFFATGSSRPIGVVQGLRRCPALC